MPNRTGITIAGESNPGLVRRHNEDNFVIVALPERSSILAVVADGVGGHSNGGMASLICCRDLADAYFSIPDEELSTPLQAEKFLRDEIRVINRKIFERNYFEELRRPMGSTILAVLFLQDSLVMASAGDTRLYELPPDRPLRQLSVDHTLSAAYLRAHGEIRKTARCSAMSSCARSGPGGSWRSTCGCFANRRGHAISSAPTARTATLPTGSCGRRWRMPSCRATPFPR